MNKFVFKIDISLEANLYVRFYNVLYKLEGNMEYE